MPFFTFEVIYYHWLCSPNRAKYSKNNVIKSSEVPRQQGRTSRKGNYTYIAPLLPTYKAWFAGCTPGQKNLWKRTAQQKP